MSLITYLSRVHFANNVLDDALGEELRRARSRRPMVVQERPAPGSDPAERLQDALPPGCEAIFFQLAPGRPLEAEGGSHVAGAHGGAEGAMAAALGQYSDAECDAVIGLGGPRALDFARLLGWTLCTRRRTRHAGPGTPPPTIAIPTTIGNIGLGPIEIAGPTRGSLRTAPSVILCDPTLIAEPPDSAATAASGFDIMCHCVEAFLGTTFNPPADGIALEGVRRMSDIFEAVLRGSGRADAGREMMGAALCAGLAAEKGLGGVEALGRALEAEAGGGVRHGQFHAALLPPVLEFNAPALGDRLDRIAEAMRLAPGSDVPRALAALGRRLGLPGHLSDAAFSSDALARAASAAASQTANRTNPRLATKADYAALLEAAHHAANPGLSGEQVAR
jgi:alcohol dehydrogenase class IV